MQRRLFKLKELYLLKALGFRYCDEETILKESNLSLPKEIEELKKMVFNCFLCELAKTRKNVVFGEGDIKANIMFIGEGPGAMEDETGRPFVGRAGQLLTKMIETVLEIPRSAVYIANIVKCRPPENRVPTQLEALSCKPYLLRQIEIVSPKLIVALGSTSYQYLTDDKTPISKIRGEIIDFGGIRIIPTFHPSYLLRNPSAKKEAYMDFLKIKSFI